MDTNRSALELRLTAFQRLNRVRLVDENADDSANRDEQRRLRAILNRTFQFYYHQNRVNDSAVLHADQQVAAATAWRAPNVTALLVASDARLARTAVADANRTLAELQARNASFDDATVREEIQHARRAIDQAEHVREHAPVPVAAITHYRRAWNHAQHALDLMDAATKPNVTITRRADPIRNGTVNYTVRGRVFDVRPHRIGNLTVTVDGQTRTTRNIANATPATPGLFALRVEVDEPTAEIIVTATDPGDEVSNRSTAWEPQRGRATLALDRDGLSDVVERELTGTDPLDADSNASSTAADESGDGVFDGREDFDGDLLTSRDEVRRGSHPAVADTDGDGLRDGFEAFVTDTDPLAVDSDADGTADGEEDPDDDGLVNADEQRAGTDPDVADTDGDGVADANELANGTDPTRADTDDDGLADGVEPHPPFETDPLDADTDGDGVPDGNETYTTTAANASVGATVSITDEGNAAADFSIQDGNRSRFGIEMIQSARVSQFVEIETERPVENARVTVSYDPSRVANESDVRLYRFNESVGTFLPIESTVHPGNDTVTARPDHFSTVAALSRSRWRANFRASFPSPFGFDERFDNDLAALDGWQTVGNVTTREGVLVVEHAPGNESGGGGGGEGGGGGGGGGGSAPDCSVSNLSAGCDNDTLTNGEEATFGTDPLDADTDDGGTPDGAEIVAGTDPLDSSDDQFQEATVGGPTIENGSAAVRTIPYPNEVAGVTVEARVRARASGADSEARLVAEHVGGRRTLLSVTSGETEWQKRLVELTDVSGTLTVEAVAEGDARVRVDFVRVRNDTDLDGLSDPRERLDCIETLAGCVETEVGDSDTDGDTLKDGFEIGNVSANLTAGELVIYRPVSRPDREHSDSDGLNDSVEVRGWDINVTSTSSGEPLRWNGQDDSTTIRATSDPLALHSDADEVPDGVEKRQLHTRANETVTYAITERHRQRIHERLLAAFRDNSDLEYRLMESARNLGIIGPHERIEALADVDLDDGTSDFDFLLADDGSVAFRALDSTTRTDTWLSNRRELAEGTEPWDPDTDGDGLTDGQEERWITRAQGTVLAVEKGLLEHEDTSPTTPDTDGDGYWDGWIGVYNASDSRNVVLYMEHLTDDDDPRGVSGDEIVTAQTGVHEIDEAPSAHGVNITGDATPEHANVHVGELHWGTSPTERDDVPNTTLRVEVDWVEGHNPYKQTRNGQSVIEAARENLLLYGFDVRFRKDDEISARELRNTPKSLVPRQFISPRTMNAHELSVVEDEFHDDSSRMHLLFATEYGGDFPRYFPHDVFIPRGVDGLEGHTGSPRQVDLLETTNNVPYGTVILNGSTGSFAQTEAVLLHELGHALSIGWRDDKGGRVGECYSGQDCVFVFGRDRTPESVGIGDLTWSIMARRGLQLMDGEYAFSIEEISTVDFEDIPSKDD